MSEIFKLVAKLVLDTSGFDKSTEESKEKASVFADVLKADLVGRGISAAWDGLKKLGGAVKDFTADAVMSYGEIEQLRGGIETLFGDSAQKVLADADQAFRTAGMSADGHKHGGRAERLPRILAWQLHNVGQFGPRFCRH